MGTYYVLINYQNEDPERHDNKIKSVMLTFALYNNRGYVLKLVLFCEEGTREQPCL